MKINGAMFKTSDDICAAIVSMPPEVPDEPTYRKAWRFVRDHRYHYTPLTGMRWQHCPALFFNSVGFGYCDDSASLLYYLWTRLGYEARVWALWGHVVPEVLVAGRWEMYDAGIPGVSETYYDNYRGFPQCVYYHTRDGRVAGVQDLEADGSLITDPQNPVNPLLDVASPYYCYSADIAALYTSTTDNVVEAWYMPPERDYELQFQIPPGGILVLPGYFTNQLRVMYGDPPPPLFATARLWIPAGFSGTLDNRLVVHSIQGNSHDTVNINTQVFFVGSPELQEFIDVRTEWKGDFFSALTFTQVTESITVSLLINPMLAGIGPTNLVQLSGEGLDGLMAEMTGVSLHFDTVPADNNALGRLRWESSARLDYTLQTCSNLPASDWTDLAGWTNIPGTGGRMLAEDLPPNTEKLFFRIKAQVR